MAIRSKWFAWEEIHKQTQVSSAGNIFNQINHMLIEQHDAPAPITTSPRIPTDSQVGVTTTKPSYKGKWIPQQLQLNHRQFTFASTLRTLSLVLPQIYLD